MNAIRNVLLIALLTLCGTPLYAQQPLPEVTLSIKGHKLTAEVAANDNSRTVGLMHRRMQRTRDLAAEYDALRQRAAFVRTFVGERKHLVIRIAKYRDVAVHGFHDARAQWRNFGECTNVMPFLHWVLRHFACSFALDV